ncbi:RNA polymerase sigma factor [Phenylobacterium sp.]|uniref:RNA polymerase sigma factor n=1 Tax=Phenylobacterium sp. TaxID=1871053 RepID=UPI0035C7F94A
MSQGASDSEAELAARALGGDDRAFAVLVRRHKNGLYGFVRRYVGDGDPAVEIIQETFVAAWLALRRYDSSRPFAVWLRAIALNKCRDRARRATVRRLVFGDRDPDAPEVQRQADPMPDAEATMLQRQRLTRLERAISRLPPKLKEPLLLTYFEEMSQQQAADLLGVSVKTVETRIYRARRRLAELLSLDLE